MWEPACGHGAITKTLMADHHPVISTDLSSRAKAAAGCYDFLAWTPTTKYDCIVTNPPFKLKRQFVTRPCVRRATKRGAGR